MPYYLSIGLDKAFIDSSCPTDLKPYEEAHKLKIMEQDSMNWYSGMYTLRAVLTAIDKAFSGKRSTAEYMDEPILAELNLTEEERYNKRLRKALAMEERWAAQASYLPDSLDGE